MIWPIIGFHSSLRTVKNKSWGDTRFRFDKGYVTMNERVNGLTKTWSGEGLEGHSQLLVSLFAVCLKPKMIYSLFIAFKLGMEPLNHANCISCPISWWHIMSYNGTIIRTGTTWRKNPLEKSIEFGVALKQIATHYKQKTEIFLVNRLLTCWNPDCCFWFERKYKKRINANL